MANEDDNKKLKEQAKGLLPPALKSVLEWFSQARALLRYLTVKGQIAFALLCLALAVWQGIYWWNSFTKLSERIRTSLDAKMDNTVWQHKGLAAYLLSNIEPTPPKPEFSVEITDTLGKVGEVTAAPLPEGGLSAERVMWMTAPSPTPGASQADSRKLHLYTVKSDRLKDAPVGQALVAGDESYFLLVPALALRREQLSYKPLTHTEDDAVLKKALEHNPDILRDIYVAQQLIPVLKRLDLGRVNRQPVAQFYFITESGLILLRSPQHISNQLKFYEQHFDPSHNFTDRSYFRGAVNKEVSNGLPPPTPFDYVSEPYIDLGGHGLIKTYSKAFELNNKRFGVLCIDVQLDKPTRDAVQKRLGVIGGESGSFYWTGSIEDKDKIPDDFYWFPNAMATNVDAQDMLLGRIATQKDYEQSADGVLRYTVPWAAEMAENGSRKVELMWVRVNLGQFLTNQKWRLVFVCVGVGLFVAVTLNVLDEYLFADKELTELAKKIDRVMTHAMNPYVRVNSDNEFVAVNDSFLKMVDYDNIDKLREAGRFRSLLTPESQRVYDRIMKESMRGKTTGVYPLTFLRPDRSQVRTSVLAERIVFPVFRRKEYAHRFGIILSWKHVAADEGDATQPAEAGKS